MAQNSLFYTKLTVKFSILIRGGVRKIIELTRGCRKNYWLDKGGESGAFHAMKEIALSIFYFVIFNSGRSTIRSLCKVAKFEGMSIHAC